MAVYGDETVTGVLISVIMMYPLTNIYISWHLATMRYTTKFSRAGLVMAAAVVLSLGLAVPGRALAATTSASHAHLVKAPRPYTAGPYCNNYPTGAWANCTTVIGSGLKITSISGFTVNDSGLTEKNMHVQIYGPNGTIKNCGTFTLNSPNGPTCTWTNPSPNTNETAGSYCSVTWQLESDGTYRDSGAECIGVHA